jgi:hypothetical protein
MAWKVGNVQDIDLGGFIPSPGFTIQQDDQPPVLTITFEDLKTAERCASSMREIIAMKERMAVLGFEPVANMSEEFAARIKAEIPKWGKVIRDANIKAEP